jgi:CRP/FNR family transcriptional regulator
MGRALAPGLSRLAPARWPLPCAAELRELDAGEWLFHQGEVCGALHWLESGVVALRRSDPEGRRRVVRLGLRGDLLGYAALLASAPHATTAQALTRCRVRRVGAAAARWWIDRSPETCAALLRQLVQDLERAEEAQLVLAHWPLPARLHWALARLAERLAEGETLHLALSRQDLASWLGARPEALARALRDLEERGLGRFFERDLRLEGAVRVAAPGPGMEEESAGEEPAE